MAAPTRIDPEDWKAAAIETHSQQAGEFAERYEALPRDPFASCFLYSRRRLDVLLQRYLPASGTGLRLLDVGCGTGHHMARLAATGFEVAGVDGSDEMLVRARERNPSARLERADVGLLPFPDQSFDFVLSVEVLRYLKSPQQALGEMRRVLRPGGVCLVTAAPLLSLNGYYVVNRIAHAVPVSDLVRLKQYFTTSWRLRGALTAAGFGETRIHGVYWGPVNWVERLAPRALSSLLAAWEPIDARVADAPLLREMANMFLVRAVRE
jgi:SAM-dependent methyltransferase